MHILLGIQCINIEITRLPCTWWPNGQSSIIYALDNIYETQIVKYKGYKSKLHPGEIF